MRRIDVDLPKEWMSLVVQHFKEFPNDTVDFNKPILRKSLKDIYPLFIILYCLLIVFGTVANVVLLLKIMKNRLYSKPLCLYLLNVTFCNLIMTLIVLPMSVAVLLIQNWVFGKVFCFIIPMIQDIPIHATTTSLVFMLIERYRSIVMPEKVLIPPAFGVLIIWILSICVVLPYSSYINYLDLQKYFGSQFEGSGLCAISLFDNIAKYIRGLFITLYLLPLAIITYLHARIGHELQKKKEKLVRRRNTREVNPTPGHRRQRNSQGEIWTAHDSQCPSSSMGLDGLRRYSGNTAAFHNEELELAKEKRDQKFICAIIMVYALCLCPLSILRLLKNVVLENYANSAHFDLTFISFVWIAFLPTFSTPLIVYIWNKKYHPFDQRRESLLDRGLNPRCPNSMSQQAIVRRYSVERNFSPDQNICHLEIEAPPPQTDNRDFDNPRTRDADSNFLQQQRNLDMKRRLSFDPPRYSNNQLNVSHDRERRHSGHVYQNTLLPSTSSSHFPDPPLKIHQSLSSHRLSVESSLSVSPRPHHRERPLTPNPSHSRMHGGGGYQGQQGSLVPPEQHYSRSHSLSYAS